MKKLKKLLFILPVAFGLSLGLTQSVEPIFTEKQTLKMKIEETSNEETGTSDLLEDKDGNGVADKLEEFYQNTTFYQLTGVALGSLVGLAISVIGLVFNIIKTKNMLEATKTVSNNANSNVIKWNENGEKIAVKTAELLSNITTLTTSNNELKEELANMKDNYDKLLAQYTKVDVKLNAILENQSETAKTTENIQNGSAKKVEQRVKEITLSE